MLKFSVSSFKYLVVVVWMSTIINAVAKNENRNGTIKGNVTTSDGQPAVSAMVTVKGLTMSAITDNDGIFVLRDIPAGTYELEISFVGSQSLTQVVVESDKTTEVHLQLQLTAKQLEEVVITSAHEFKSMESEYANKMPLSYLENSQSYTTITKGLIKDQVLFTVDDAMRNVAGMQKMWDATGRAGDGGAYYDLRGFTVQTTMRNGMANMITTTTDAANVEKVEILKGPSATLYGSALTSFGGLVNRVTKKPYDHFGGEVNVSGGSYQFMRASADINTLIDKASKVMFRLNGAYNTQGSFQKLAGTGNRSFIAPGLLIKPSDRLSISLDAELTYARSVPSQMMFLYFTGTDLGFNNAVQTGLDYKNSYVGKDIHTNSRSSNYYANATYKLSGKFNSFTNVSHSRSYSNGHNQYFFQVPNDVVTGDVNDRGTPSKFLARADQSTRNSRNNIFELQQYFNGEFEVAGMRNRAVVGLDYTNINSDQRFYSQDYIDIVPTNAPGFDYSTFNSAAIDQYYDTANVAAIQHYPLASKTNIYSAFASDVLNLTGNLELIAALRLDHFNNHDHTSGISYNQTALSPKFGLVYQPIKDQLSLFANYQNSFSNQGSYIAYNPGSLDSLSSKFAKPVHANQWEIGIKTNLVRNKLTATFSYYDIKVDNMLRTDSRYPVAAQIQNGTQESRGVELEVISNPIKGFTVLGGVAYHDFSYQNTSDDIAGFRYSGSPWLLNGWLSYQFDKALKGFHIGFGGNYANNNKIQDSPTQGVFFLPAYTVLNVAIGYDAKKYSIAFKVDNLLNEHYWQGYTTYNPQMLRQFVGSVTYRF